MQTQPPIAPQSGLDDSVARITGELLLRHLHVCADGEKLGKWSTLTQVEAGAEVVSKVFVCGVVAWHSHANMVCCAVGLR